MFKARQQRTIDEHLVEIRERQQPHEQRIQKIIDADTRHQYAILNRGGTVDTNLSPEAQEAIAKEREAMRAIADEVWAAADLDAPLLPAIDAVAAAVAEPAQRYRALRASVDQRNRLAVATGRVRLMLPELDLSEHAAESWRTRAAHVVNPRRVTAQSIRREPLARPNFAEL